jgi:hypothetical protein
METLTERQGRALQMRRDGKKLKEIGQALEVSAGRARAIVERALMIERQAEWAQGLPARYVRLLMSRGVKSMGGLREAIQSGNLQRMPGVGDKSFAAICGWMARQ